jgi:hypothetical protein
VAAPEFVPRRPTDAPRSYSSPPPRAGSWETDRPAEVVADGQPRGDRLGNQGPDQGYVYKLVRQFEDKIVLKPGEDLRDAIAGCIGVALKRASLFGRAPVVHDLTVAFTVWGFLDPDPPADLLERRRHLFEEVRNPHHYLEQRAIADAVPDDVLRLPHTALVERYRTGGSLLQPA